MTDATGRGGFLRRRRQPPPTPPTPPPPPPIRADSIYPYLVTEGYPDALTTPTQTQRRIGHGLSLALVSPTGPAEGQVVGAVTAARLAAAKIDLATAYVYADCNLSRALSDQQIALQFFEGGSTGFPSVAASEHWLAATTLVAPGLHGRMTQFLGDDIVAAVPHRGLLLLFSAGAAASMADVIEEEFSAAAKPLTTALFTLSNDGARPIQ